MFIIKYKLNTKISEVTTLKTTDMTSGRPMRLIFLFALPLMFGGLFQQLYIVVDTIIVGRGVGISALASLGASDWINWLVLWGIYGFTQGLSIIIAQKFGAKDYSGLRKALATITLLCIVFGLILTVISLLAVRPLLLLLKTDPAIVAGAQSYLYVMFSGTLAVIAYNMAAAILRCLGDSRTPLISLLLSSAVNIVLDILFVLVFHWGIPGAAAATIIAQLLSFLLCLHVLRQIPMLSLQPQDWKPERAMVLHLCRLGFPTAFQNSIISVGGMVLQSVINSYGFLFVAGFTATNKLYGVLESSAIAFGYAMTTYMGQNSGAGETKRIDSGLRSILILSFVFSSAIACLMIAFGRHILSLFISASEENSAHVLEIAYHYLFIMSCFLFILFLIHVYRSSLQGLDNTFVPMLSGISEMITRVAVAWLLPHFFGQSGIYFAEVCAWIGATLPVLLYYHCNIRKIKLEIQSIHPQTT